MLLLVTLEMSFLLVPVSLQERGDCGSVDGSARLWSKALRQGGIQSNLPRIRLGKH